MRSKQGPRLYTQSRPGGRGPALTQPQPCSGTGVSLSLSLLICETVMPVFSHMAIPWVSVSSDSSQIDLRHETLQAC